MEKLSDKEMIEELRDALLWLITRCEMNETFGIAFDGLDREAIKNAEDVLEKTIDY